MGSSGTGSRTLPREPACVPGTEPVCYTAPLLAAGGHVTASSSDQPRVDELRQRLAAHGQAHVLRFWRDLDDAGRRRLAAQVDAIDLDAVDRALGSIRARAAAEARRIEPAPVERLPQHGGDGGRWAAARHAGEVLLAEGRVAVLVVAGGQATRLGGGLPKGALPIGPVSGRSLFGLQAQRIRRLRARARATVPWYVMTSAATDQATRALFAQEQYFGLPAQDVVFFAQGSMPAVDFDGRILLDRPDHIAASPDGHGGAIPALAASGALDDLEARGCSQVFFYQVDNPLVRIGDPVYLGLHALSGAEVSCKVVGKRDPMEKVGHAVCIDGQTRIVEYTEIGSAARDARNAHGDLLLWAGAISIYVWDTALLRRIAQDADRALPFHASPKPIPVVGDGGQTTRPVAANGWKLERFVFDGLGCAKRVGVVETGREEYSPVKNASGGESPETARRDLSNLYRGWLAEAGITLVPDTGLVEIDESLFGEAQDFLARGITRVAQAGDAIRIASGVNP